MKYKITIIILAIIVLLLSLKFNSTINSKENDIKLIKAENEKLYKQLSESNSKLAKYEGIINTININKNINYVYYDIPLTIFEQEYIQDLCFANNISYELVLSVIKLESNFDHTLLSETNDGGLFQINNRYKDFYAQLSGLTEYDIYKFEDACKMGIAGLLYYRDYWINQGVTDQESLYLYMLNSYNMGVQGYTKYINNTGEYSRSYDRLITKHKTNLEQSFNK